MYSEKSFASLAILLVLIGASTILLTSRMVPIEAAELEIFNNGEWIVKIQEDDPGIPEDKMDVFLDGVFQGKGKLVQFHNRTETGGKFPQVVVIASSGFIRIKQGADPQPPIPFGTSVVLGPAYFDENDTLFFNPQIGKMEIDTSSLLADGTGTLHLTLTGTMIDDSSIKGGLDTSYNIQILEPSDFETQMKVAQTYVVSSPFSLNSNRVNNNDAFRLVQFSSMYIDEPTHDSDGAQFMDENGDLVKVNFRDVLPGNFIFSSASKMGEAWFDSVHSDDTGFQGNTPNIRVMFEDITLAEATVPQGFISPSSDPNNDNVGLWLHDTTAPSQFNVGDMRAISYFLIARDNPFVDTKLSNISTRGVVQTGDNVQIGGFIIGGTEPKTVLIRARGPVLADFGVPGELADPVLQLFSGQTVIAENDNWETTLPLCQNSGLNCGGAAEITATGLDPCVGNLTGCARESAILVTLDPGPYTAIVSGLGGATGVGLVEVFEVGTSTSRLTNISTRGLKKRVSFSSK